jgi:hypothetical protein
MLFIVYFKCGNIDTEHKLFGGFSLQSLHLKGKDEGCCYLQKWDPAFGERGDYEAREESCEKIEGIQTQEWDIDLTQLS